MRTALRKMGNSTGMIVPKAILTELALGSGTAVEIMVEDGRIVATPIVMDQRAGWSAAAAEVADEIDPEAEAWRSIPQSNDNDLTW